MKGLLILMKAAGSCTGSRRHRRWKRKNSRGIKRIRRKKKEKRIIKIEGKT